MTVFVDASCDIHYSSYYIQGLYEVFGRSQVKFSSSYFKPFRHDNHFFAFVVQDAHVIKKIVIDFTDSSSLDTVALNWCDIYGKINLDPEMTTSSKVIAIGPSFGIRIYNRCFTLGLALINLCRAYKRIPNKRKFLSDYKAQWFRPKLSDYQHQPSQNSYIFFMSSLWKQESETNKFRANFIKSCQTQNEITFEGGFAPRTRNDIEGYEDLTTTQRISMSDYLEKTSKSLVVFNTPAVKSCHGWKLAEYLCLGKAIISTPLSRALPSPLNHLEQVFLSSGDQASLEKAITQLMTNLTLRQSLEVEARTYFENYLSPKQVIQGLMDYET